MIELTPKARYGVNNARGRNGYFVPQAVTVNRYDRPNLSVVEIAARSSRPSKVPPMMLELELDDARALHAALGEALA